MIEPHTIQFLCNEQTLQTSESAGLLVLDFLRQKKHLVGTKEGCKEGDCGACAVLIGEEVEGRLRYTPVTSCLVPLGDLEGKHLVTIEGLNLPQKALNPVQEAVVSEGGTQCGFCTPGIVVSMTWMLLSEEREPSLDRFKVALSGHLCRCTGYGSLHRASLSLCNDFGSGGKYGAIWKSPDRIQALIEAKMLPAYFATIQKRLRDLAMSKAEAASKAAAASFSPKADATEAFSIAATTSEAAASSGGKRNPVTSEATASSLPIVIAGGTDLYVQKGEHLPDAKVRLLNAFPGMRGLRVKDDAIYVGALMSFEDFGQEPVIRTLIPRIEEYLWLIASLQIRTRATLGGNIVNASPIGDMTNLLLALNSSLILSDGRAERRIAMKDFFKGYKILDKKPEELVTEIVIPAFQDGTKVHFEKISKRTCLDIATVNASARVCAGDAGIIQEIHLALGGVAAIPLYLRKTTAAMLHKPLSPQTLREALPLVQTEIAPISDVRGSADYKRLLARQLLLAAFTEMYPTIFSAEDLVA